MRKAPRRPSSDFIESSFAPLRHDQGIGESIGHFGEKLLGLRVAAVWASTEKKPSLVIFVSRGFQPALLDQFGGRLDRLGLLIHR